MSRQVKLDDHYAIEELDDGERIAIFEYQEWDGEIRYRTGGAAVILEEEALEVLGGFLVMWGLSRRTGA